MTLMIDQNLNMNICRHGPRSLVMIHDEFEEFIEHVVILNEPIS
jgi:hypothetical protein